MIALLALAIFAAGIAVGANLWRPPHVRQLRSLSEQYAEDTAIVYRAAHVRDVEAQALMEARRVRSRRQRVSWLRLVPSGRRAS